MDEGLSAALVEVLDRSRAIGFLGPGPVDAHIGHASLFGRAVESFGRAVGSAELRFADIGAGGGVPGLPMLVDNPDLSAVLIDSSQKRCSFLVWAVGELGLSDRAEVWCGRAEDIGHQDRGRERFDVVVARGFGPPAVTLECAAPLAIAGGRVVISEPPIPRRWPPEALRMLGLTQLDAESGVAVFGRTGDVPPSLPRPTKQLQRSPLFEME